MTGVARTVFFHVGLPKTGTTYLQSILWHNRAELREQDVLLPGFGPRQHLWASGVVREDPHLDRRSPEAKHAWVRLRSQVNAWDGTAVLSHEFFAGATEAQAAAAMADLAGAEVHVVLTARDTLSLVTARWQEIVKNGSTVPIDAYPADEVTDPLDEWDWGTMDAADVLCRWGATLPPERVHVLTLPRPGEPRETLWRRFAELVGIDATRCDPSGSEQNESLGVVEVELLRRINAHLEGFTTPYDRGVWIRRYLAQGKLVPRQGEKFWPSPSRVEELRARSERVVEAIKQRQYDVIGDVEDLRTPAVLQERRHPDTVTEAEMLAVATGTIAAMLADVRLLTEAAERPVVTPEVPRRWRDRLPQPLRRAVHRARTVWPRS